VTAVADAVDEQMLQQDLLSPRQPSVLLQSSERARFGLGRRRVWAFDRRRLLAPVRRRSTRLYSRTLAASSTARLATSLRRRPAAAKIPRCRCDSCRRRSTTGTDMTTTTTTKAVYRSARNRALRRNNLPPRHWRNHNSSDCISPYTSVVFAHGMAVWPVWNDGQGLLFNLRPTSQEWLYLCITHLNLLLGGGVSINPDRQQTWWSDNCARCLNSTNRPVVKT